MTEKENQNLGEKHLLAITLDKANRTSVTLDGVDISAVVTEIKYIQKGRNFPVVEFGLLGCGVSLACYGPRPELPEILRPYYKPVEVPPA